MSADQTTIAVYDARANEYAEATNNIDGYEYLEKFTNALPKNARVLDLGCGPGIYAAYLAKAGYAVDAIDASAEMVKLAGQYANVTAIQATFDDISGNGVYDGIWANFSLLHASRTDFPRYLAALKQACKTNAVFHIAMKLGSGEKRDTIDRYYTYYSKDELLTYIAAAGFVIEKTFLGRGPGLDGTITDWAVVFSHA